MNDYIQRHTSLSELGIWEKRKQNNALISFTLELTARCNNNCRHCYINLPEGDKQAIAAELPFEKIKDIADQAVAMGAVWCLITGGEPLLRPDFEEIYLYLKRQGLLVSVFTNATLIRDRHVELFRQYPPRDLEVTVYGITKSVYGKVTRRPDLFDAFKEGLNRLLDNQIPVNLKGVFMKANVAAFEAIGDFCRRHSARPFRFDPLLHLRFDGDESKNREIRAQRLDGETIAALEASDAGRLAAMQDHCDKLILPDRVIGDEHYLFSCGAGISDFVVSYDGWFRLCSSLWHPDCIYDLKTGNLKEALAVFVPEIRAMTSTNPDYLNHCETCSLVNLCLWCPAHCYLETGCMDISCDHFCDVAKSRAALLNPDS
ncbi:MAG: radical SAM protein [Thermodesulfobacteriota bacterium]|nr:radical SAM protein [Thermodesulfobacteriota bacterium]